MRKGLLAALMALLVCGSAGLAYASGHDTEAASAASDGDPAAGTATDPGQDASGGTPPKDEAKSDADLMKNFTRHRRGACPEGPPCKVED
jgi:hypothetical protein